MTPLEEALNRLNTTPRMAEWLTNLAKRRPELDADNLVAMHNQANGPMRDSR